MIECAECDGLGVYIDTGCGDMECCPPITCSLCYGEGEIEEEE